MTAISHHPVMDIFLQGHILKCFIILTPHQCANYYNFHSFYSFTSDILSIYSHI